MNKASPRLRLIHWNLEKARECIGRLRDPGYRVDHTLAVDATGSGLFFTRRKERQ